MRKRDFERGIRRIIRIGHGWHLLDSDIARLLGFPNCRIRRAEMFAYSCGSMDAEDRISYMTRLKKAVAKIHPRVGNQRWWIHTHDERLPRGVCVMCMARKGLLGRPHGKPRGHSIFI